MIEIPAQVKHWHGAAPDSAMTHIAITEMLDGKAADWLEQVADAQYLAAPSVAQGQQGFDGIVPRSAN